MTELSDDHIRRLQSLVDLPDLTGTKYKIVEQLARGGMGTVYKAFDRELNREISLKVLTVPDSSGGMVERMLNEARILAKLEHPSIIPVHDVGRLPDSRLYYVMKLVQGKTLTQWLDLNPPLRERLALFQQVCQAVAFAHSREVIHRDIKPDNIMVGEFGEVLLMDWGVAKLFDAVDKVSRADKLAKDGATTRVNGTEQGTRIGTPAYMSPEQRRGATAEIDQLSDIYMLGATLYYLLTGKHPSLVGDSEADTSTEMAYPAHYLRELNPEIKRALAAICTKALAAAKIERYQNALEFSQDIGRFLDHEPVGAYPESIWERTARWLAKHQLLVYVLIAYLVIRAIIFFTLGR